MTTPQPRHPVSGRYVSTSSASPSVFVDMCAAGSTDTDSRPSPTFSQPATLPTYGTELEQQEFKIQWAQQMGTTGTPGVGPADSSVAGDSLPGNGRP